MNQKQTAKEKVFLLGFQKVFTLMQRASCEFSMQKQVRMEHLAHKKYNNILRKWRKI